MWCVILWKISSQCHKVNVLDSTALTAAQIDWMWSVLFRDSGWWNAIRSQRSGHLVVWLAQYYFSLNITHLPFWGSPLHCESTWFQSGDYIFVQMWELDHKESWAFKNQCFWTVVLEKTLESPLDCKEIQPVNPKRNQPWIFIGMTDAKAKVPILWLPDVKNYLIRKDPCWERLKAGEGDDRGWGSWMASMTQQTWVLSSSGSWWWTGKPGLLQSIWSQRIRHDWTTELNWTQSQ